MRLPENKTLCDATAIVTVPAGEMEIRRTLTLQFNEGRAENMFSYLAESIPVWDYNSFRWACSEMVCAAGKRDADKAMAIEVLTLLNDRRYFTGDKKRAWILWIVRGSLREIFAATPGFDKPAGSR
jgi:hypothetical protein